MIASLVTAAELVRALQCDDARCRCHHSARAGRGLTHCPAHDDANPSLSVNEADDGRVLVHCQAGCGQDKVIAALRAQNLWPDPASANGHAPVTVVRTTEYPIRDQDGRLVAYHVRRDLSNGDKTFVWKQPDGTIGLGGRRTASLPLYGVHDLGDAPDVIVVEGEKAADALRGLGFAAVGTVTGASSAPGDDALRPLVGRRVMLWPDADDPGRAHMQRIAARLLDLGCADVRVIRWAGARPGDDAADFVRRGGGTEDVFRLTAEAEPWQSGFSGFSSSSSRSSRSSHDPRNVGGRMGRETETGQDSASGREIFSSRGTEGGEFSSRDTGSDAESAGRESEAFRLTALGDLLAEPEEQIDWLVQDMLPSGGVSLLGAKPKVGKSTTARCLALAVARGEPFLGRETAQGPVIYLALEEKRAEIAKHFRRLGAGSDDPVHVHIGMAPEHALDALASAIETHRPALVIIDPLLKLVRVRDANDYAEVTRALEPVIELARQSGAHLMLIHHLSKGEKGERDGGDAILGSTALFGAVDTAILMRRNPNDGTRTIETIQRYGEDMPESVITLDEQTGALTLAGTVAERKQAEAEAAILEALRDEPLTEPEIRDAVELKGIVVSRALRSLVERGVLQRIGAGRRGDPYRYQKFSSHSSPYAGKSGRESENGQDSASGREEFSSHSSPYTGKSGRESETGRVSASGREEFSSQRYRPDPDTAGREFRDRERESPNDTIIPCRSCGQPVTGQPDPNQTGWLRFSCACGVTDFVRADDPGLMMWR